MTNCKVHAEARCRSWPKCHGCAAFNGDCVVNIKVDTPTWAKYIQSDYEVTKQLSQWYKHNIPMNDVIVLLGMQQDIVDGKYIDNDYRNTYVDIEIGGIPYLFLNLDYALTVAELEWANKVCQQFPNLIDEIIIIFLMVHFY